MSELVINEGDIPHLGEYVSEVRELMSKILGVEETDFFPNIVIEDVYLDTNDVPKGRLDFYTKHEVTEFGLSSDIVSVHVTTAIIERIAKESINYGIVTDNAVAKGFTMYDIAATIFLEMHRVKIGFSEEIYSAANKLCFTQFMRRHRWQGMVKRPNED